jgi:DNA integrity scanning protein DisA with diadenylate cyclase activity
MTLAALKALCSRIPWCEPAVLESVLELALEIGREGREGRRIGTLFTVGKAAVEAQRLGAATLSLSEAGRDHEY